MSRGGSLVYTDDLARTTGMEQRKANISANGTGEERGCRVKDTVSYLQPPPLGFCCSLGYCTNMRQQDLRVVSTPRRHKVTTAIHVTCIAQGDRRDFGVLLTLRLSGSASCKLQAANNKLMIRRRIAEPAVACAGLSGWFESISAP